MEGHKLNWHLDRVQPWLQGERIVPVTLDMGITRKCNMNCIYCYYGNADDGKQSETIPTDALLRLIGDCARLGVRGLSFAGDGEPMLHPGIYQAVMAGAEAGLDMAVSTNGSRIKKSELTPFLGALSWIRFSISAASPESYAAVMGTKPTVYEKVVRNIAACVAAKKEHRLKVTIGMQMVLLDDFVDQVIPLVRLGRELGVDYTVIKQYSDRAGSERPFSTEGHDRFSPVFLEAESYARKGYHVIIKRRKMAVLKRDYDRCYGCEFLTQISGSGDLYPCGNLYGVEAFRIGNIIHEPFAKIIRSQQYARIMEKVKREIHVHKDCGARCRVNEINQFLWMLKHPPEHLNFI